MSDMLYNKLISIIYVCPGWLAAALKSQPPQKITIEKYQESPHVTFHILLKKGPKMLTF